MISYYKIYVKTASYIEFDKKIHPIATAKRTLYV